MIFAFLSLYSILFYIIIHDTSSLSSDTLHEWSDTSNLFLVFFFFFAVINFKDVYFLNQGLINASVTKHVHWGFNLINIITQQLDKNNNKKYFSATKPLTRQKVILKRCYSHIRVVPELFAEHWQKKSTPSFCFDHKFQHPIADTLPGTNLV